MSRSIFPAGRSVSPKVIAAGIVGVALAAVGCSSQKAPVVNISNDPSAAQRGIVVTGRGEVSGAPDTVSLSIGVSVKRPTAPAAISDAAASATQLIDALKAAGVAEQDIQTTNYSINQEFQYPPNAAPKADGFRVANNVVAKIRSTGDVGAVIDAATAAGGTDAVVQGVSFTLDDNDAALVEAREKAFNEAKKKAEQFAELSGRKLGAVVSINQTEGATQPTFQTVGFAADAAQRSTPIEPGTVDTTVSVDVRWSFEE